MKILALDSSAVSGSVCILDDGKVKGSMFINTRQTHSRTLMVMTENLLNATETPLEDIDYFAVSSGPGSFTGVRIGVSCVKGMAMALDKECVGISTLYAMACSCTMLDGIICTVMDARCAQVYNALFRVEDGKITRITDDRALSIKELANELDEYKEEIYLIGDGADVCMKTDEIKALGNVKILPESSRYQIAVGVAIAAEQAIEQDDVVSAGDLRPIYLRLPQAERELKKKQEGLK